MQTGTSDATLMGRIRAGDEAAMAAVYDRYSGLVYAVALRVLTESSAAEDVLQDIFMQLWRNPQGFDSARGSLGAWLSVVARNRAVDRLRQRRTDLDIDDVVIAFPTRLDDEAERNLMAGKARQALGLMPAEQRRAVEMAFFEGLTHSEIAQKTGEPLGTIKTRIRGAMISLRKVLQ